MELGRAAQGIGERSEPSGKKITHLRREQARTQVTGTGGGMRRGGRGGWAGDAACEAERRRCHFLALLSDRLAQAGGFRLF
jgi:hypothetical protein